MQERELWYIFTLQNNNKMKYSITIFVQPQENAKWQSSETKYEIEVVALDKFSELCKLAITSVNNVQIELSKGLGVIGRYSNNKW